MIFLGKKVPGSFRPTDGPAPKMDSMEEKQRTGPRRKTRRSYLNDFQPDLNGNYVYRGSVYRWAVPDRTRSRSLISLWCLSLCAAAAVIVCGIVPAAGMSRCFYVLLPYLGEVGTLLLLLWRLARLSLAGKDLNGYVYEAPVVRLPRTAAAFSLVTLVVLAAEILYTLFHPVDAPPATTVFQLLQLAAAALVWRFRREVRRQRWDCG